jgi:2-methylcitrate dehydratase PrpD
VGLAYEEDADCDLPAEAVHHTKGMLIDTMGCAIGGHVSKSFAMAWGLAATVFS